MTRGKGIGFVVGLVAGLVLNALGLFASDIIMMAAIVFGCATFGWVCDLIGYIASGNYQVDRRLVDATRR